MSEDIIEKIICGRVGIIPTDTIFGIVASALMPDSVNRIYYEKSRPESKPFVIIISGYDQLALIGIDITNITKQLLEEIWPSPVSVLLPCPSDAFSYLHRGTRELAVRMPDKQELREFLSKTGPLVATSANISGMAMSDSLVSIKKQLPNLDFYVDGPSGTTPSRLARLHGDGTVEWLSRS